MLNKGFTLAEMVAVIAIVMILALISTPFIKGYIDDAYNGKALIFLRQLNEARMNFEKDYSGVIVEGRMDNGSAATCEYDKIEDGGKVNPSLLIGCKYLSFPTELVQRYSFVVGDDKQCILCKESVVSMLGLEKAGI